MSIWDGSDLNWLILAGATPSKLHPQGGKTGPDGDHSTAAGDGNYVYVEATGNTPGKTFTMVTPKFDIRNLDKPHLSFWCHMYSGDNHMGELIIDILVDGKWNNDVIKLDNDHGDKWFPVEQDLVGYVGNRVQFRIRGITGTDYDSDICIDDFRIGTKEGTGIVTETGSSLFPELKYFASKLHFSIPELSKGMNSHVSIELYNLNGKHIRNLVNGFFRRGVYSISLKQSPTNAKLSAGIYLCKMKTGSFSKSIDVVILD